jgi:plasmid stabilization system protein ParE
MHLRWTEAAADLERIADYRFVQAPTRAPGLVRSIYEAPEALQAFPYRGRPGKKAGTCELVLSPRPWIEIYTVRDDAIDIGPRPARRAAMAVSSDERWRPGE